VKRKIHIERQKIKITYRAKRVDVKRFRKKKKEGETKHKRKRKKQDRSHVKQFEYLDQGRKNTITDK
jgi:DNA-binding SARP family transcriptional activator